MVTSTANGTTPTCDRRPRLARNARPIGRPLALVLALAGGIPVAWAAQETVFEDAFRNGPDSGWKILREERDAWRATPNGLEIRALPGNMWGPANDAKNTFIRPAPDPTHGPVEVTVRVENRPTEQYEQVDLVWYYADSHQVKIGQELVDGQLSIVMGREEGDRTRTIAIIPIESPVVDLRFLVEGTTIQGAYRTPDMTEWKPAGTCDLPVRGEPKISLQVYQGPADVERWARISQFRVKQEPANRRE